jgi:hypothetical protein
VDEILMPQSWGGLWWSLLDADGRNVGRAKNGHVRDADDLLIARPAPWPNRTTVVAGDGSLVGTTAPARTDDGRKKRNTFALRLGDSDQVVAEYADGIVHLAGAEGREVATIVGISRYVVFTDWRLTFTSCENPRLRLIILSLLAEQAVGGGGA